MLPVSVPVRRLSGIYNNSSNNHIHNNNSSNGNNNHNLESSDMEPVCGVKHHTTITSTKVTAVWLPPSPTRSRRSDHNQHQISFAPHRHPALGSPRTDVDSGTKMV
jgi:hypothetical protein